MSRSSFCAILFVLTVLLLVAACNNSSSSPASTNAPASSGTTATSKPAAGTCYNAYYPASATMKKTYKITYASGPLKNASYTESYSNVTSDGFVQKLEFAPTEAKGKDGVASGVTVEGGVKCQPDGLAILEYGNLTAGQEMTYKYKTTNRTGISFPPDSEWQVGKKWQMVYDVEGQMTEAPIEAMKMSPKGTITINCEIIGKESVTVPTGTYDAFKVAMTYNSNMKMTMKGREMPFNMSFKSNTWFAKDVGMIKSSAAEFKAVTELVTLTK